jgi:GDP/UDP-N,N'-diacetylbacillosamine 2-epimerase (hydrolysing)
MEENTFRNSFEIPDKPYVLVTFHPETVNPQENKQYGLEMKSAL